MPLITLLRFGPPLVVALVVPLDVLLHITIGATSLSLEELIEFVTATYRLSNVPQP